MPEPTGVQGAATGADATRMRGLSSALRRDSIDFRVDGEVRCKLSVDEDSKAAFSGKNGAMVALAGIAHPRSDHEAATKYYVDTVASGLTMKGSVHYAVTGDLEAASYTDSMLLVGDGAFSELRASLFDLDVTRGRTIEAQFSTEPLVADADELVATKFLVNGQVDKRQNGVYFLHTATAPWTLKRCASLFDKSGETIQAGSFVFVRSGHRHANGGFVLVSNDGERAIRIKGDAPSEMQFEQFSGAAHVSAGYNMHKVGETMNLNRSIEVSKVETQELETSTLTVADSAKIDARTLIGCGATQPSGAATRIDWSTAKGDKWTDLDDATGKPGLAESAALLVGGAAYVDGRLTVNNMAVVEALMIENWLQVPKANVTDSLTAALLEVQTARATNLNVADASLVTLGVTGITTMHNVVNMNDKTFVGCGPLQPGGATTRRRWQTDIPTMSNDAALVVGGESYFDRKVHVANELCVRVESEEERVATTLSVGARSVDISAARGLSTNRLFVGGDTSIEGKTTLTSDADIQGRTLIACGTVQPDGSRTRREWAGIADGPWTGSALVVGGKAYVDGKLEVNAGSVQPGGDETVMCLDATGFRVRTGRSHRIDLASGVFRLDGVEKVLLKSGGFYQESTDSRNVYNGHTLQQGSMHIRGGNRAAMGLRFDDGKQDWEGAPFTRDTADDYTGASLVVDGKAYVSGRLVVAGDGGACVRGDVALDSDLRVEGTATLNSVADFRGRTFIGCGPKQPDGSDTRSTWDTGKLDGGPSTDATLVVGGKTYMDGGLLVNAGSPGPGASCETRMLLDKSTFRVQVGESNTERSAGIVLASSFLNIDGVEAMMLQSGGILQKSGTSRNVYDGHTLQRRPMHIVNADSVATRSGLEYDAKNKVWSGPGFTRSSSDYTGASLVVDGKAYVNGRLVVAGDGGACIGGDVALDGDLRVAGKATLSSVADIAGKTFIGCGPKQPDGSATRRVWQTDERSDGWAFASEAQEGDRALLLEPFSAAAALIVGGKTYMDGGLIVNGSAGGETAMLVDDSLGFRVQVAPSTKGERGASIGLRGEAFVLDGVGEVRLQGGGIKQYGESNTNEYGAHTSHLRPVCIEGDRAGLRYDADQREWKSTGSTFVAGSSNDYSGASLVVGGKAFLNGKLVVADGACIHGNVSLDQKLTVGGPFDPPSSSVAATLLVNGSTYMAGPLHLGGDVSAAGGIAAERLSVTTATFRGDCYAQSFYSTSDVDLKQDIRRIDGAVARCQRIRGVEFKWKHGTDRREQMGCIAQEVGLVFPSLVSEMNGHKSVDYSKMVGLLVEAVKELKAEIDELRAERRAPMDGE
jgi:hypothetical protein